MDLWLDAGLTAGDADPVRRFVREAKPRQTPSDYFNVPKTKSARKKRKLLDQSAPSSADESAWVKKPMTAIQFFVRRFSPGFDELKDPIAFEPNSETRFGLVEGMGGGTGQFWLL